MFSNILGCASGGGWGGDKNTLAPVNHDIFNDGDAVADFENMLLPPAEAATISQGAHVGVQPLGVPLPPLLAGGGHPPPPPLHLPGGGGNAGQQPVAGDEPYSGIGSAMKKLDHTMHDPATIKAELVVQCSINPTNATSCSSFRDFANQCPTAPRLLSNVLGTSTRHYDPHPWSILLHQPCNERLPGPGVGIHWRPKGYKGAQPSVHAACPQQRPGSGSPATR